MLTSSVPCGSEADFIAGSRGDWGVARPLEAVARRFGVRAAVAGRLGSDLGLGFAAGFGLAVVVGFALAVAAGFALAVAAGFDLAVVAGFGFVADAVVVRAGGSERAPRLSLRRCGRVCGNEPSTEASDLSLIAGLIVLTYFRGRRAPGYSLPLCVQYFQQAAFWRRKRTTWL